VAGMPFAFYKLGAVKVTVLLIAAQMVTSVIWDYIIDGIGLNLYKVIGIIFAILSVTMITLAKN
jgi:transporter family-2 protein